ncbi:Xaa-Pro peptidase family protein [Bradyrhizobium sp. CB82]|uniref:M24 family metallopeptidase n=1 Tax=Bradyrhizobium sp. CB82 TaxID=3039159 RepID=UPI0024B07A98|nr:Xaa-Pro peptidase family protein [Bradyrhizobium sp. CB82]WFU39916.1 Xaa-Pro peptidase family protein [Bradyrhizobium sp. CB82]
MTALDCASITTIPCAPFSQMEYENRVEQARRLMKRYAFDALLVTSEHNLRYFVGEIGPTPHQTTRPRFLLIPSSDEAVAILPSGLDEFYGETTWLKNYRTWSGPNPKDEGVSTLAKTLREQLPDHANVGTELGAESRLGFPVGDFLRVVDAIKPRTFADASDTIFTPLRMIKSPAEIDRIRTVCGIVSEAFINLPEKLRCGMTEREACRLFELECFIRGVDKTTRINSASGRGGCTRPYGVPTDKPLSDGDLLFIDAGCLFDFYWSDFNRNFVFGAPDPHTEGAYQLVWDATEAGIAAVKPGIPICDIWSAMSNVLNRGKNRGNPTSIGRMGHSMGLWMPELPSVQPDDKTILKPGMIINVEPSTNYPSHFDGSPKLMLHEEVVVVTELGAQLLTSRASRTIPVVAT